MAQAQQGRILTTELVEGLGLDQAKLAVAAKLSGRSALSLGFDIMRVARGPQKLLPMEYLGYGLWRKEMTPERRAQYVSLHTNKAVNERLVSPDADRMASLMVDKHMTALVLGGMGLPVPHSKAIFSPDIGYGALHRLTTAEALADYITRPENLPLFGKPVAGSRSLGAISILSAAGGDVTLGDGREVSARALAGEVAQAFPRGWILQDLIRSDPVLQKVTGPALAALRFVTIWGAQGPEPFYALWRLPAKGAMTDGVVSGTNIMAELDPLTGVVRKARYGDYVTGHAASHALIHPEEPLIGVQIPHWARVNEVVIEGHRAFPGHGLLGWDVAVTAAGPVVTEINSNPLHTLFQRGVDEGFKTPERMARVDQVASLLRARMARFAGRA